MRVHSSYSPEIHGCTLGKSFLLKGDGIELQIYLDFLKYNRIWRIDNNAVPYPTYEFHGVA